MDSSLRWNDSEAELDRRRELVRAGWGEKYQQRVRDKHKMTVWERVEALADSPESILPVLTFVNDGELFGSPSPLGGEGLGVRSARTAPSAGVVTAFVRIHHRWTIVIANDNSVASGSWWPRTPEKIIRAQEMALKLRLPVVYLVDCSGLFLPEQSRSFPGKYGAGHIFKMTSELSAAGVPQIAGVMGDCIAGGGYMPIISDKVYMTEQAYMVIAGAALIQGAKSQKLSSLDIGGAHVHVHISNCADFRVPDDETCLSRIREEIAQTNSSAITYYRNHADAAEPAYSPSEISSIMPTSPGMSYDIRQVIARLVDDSLFWEMWPDIGHEVIVGVAKISGLYVGIAANVQDLLPHPQHADQKRPGGILYREGVAKLSAFSRACNDDGIPLIWLQDIAGFDVGVEAEKQGLLGYGSSLIYSNSTNTTPMFTVLLRKASGAGYYAMAGLPYEPVVQLSTPLSRLAVMEGKTLALGASKVESERQAIEARIERDMDPYRSASQMDTDEIVKLSELRPYLVCFAEASYQSQGVRRIKNPRIWSLHDLALLNQTSSPTSPADAKALAGRPDLSPQQPDLSPQQPDLSPQRRLGSNHTPQPPLPIGEGERIIAPMDGMFYLRASPNDPPFVVEGDLIKLGDTVGLMEVMKCFYPVKYSGNESRRVDEILTLDGTAVKAGQLLMSFKVDRNSV